MISYADARAHVLARCTRLSPRTVDLDDAAGSVLATDVVAAEAVPPFANSAMDGYAIRADDVEGASPASPVRLRVVGTVLAGQAGDLDVGTGCAARIMTGAPMPRGADAVVVVERSEMVGPDEVLLSEGAHLGRHVRPAGDDVAPGDLVLEAGTVLAPAHLGVLASVGCRRPVVVPRPSVAVVSTGDELVDDDRPLGPGQIRETNRPTLMAAVTAFGMRAVDFGTVPDDAGQIRAALIAAASAHDAVITTGGVSMGDVDLVKVVLGEVADMTWMQVAIRPAKPFAFGVLDGTPVFGLPGNPVSSLVSLAMLALPGLRAMAGRGDLDLPRVRVRVAEGLDTRTDGRTAFVRARVGWVDGRFEAVPVSRQGSHQLAASADANALLVVDGAVQPGETADAVLLRDPFGP
ncbi:MAG: molybdopterin molybdotransferase MoeA [Acidimicrobiales bacterium]|nr:molybdopterin molybdotransferase MoeA [Acidimicrobiales bacterium]